MTALEHDPARTGAPRDPVAVLTPRHIADALRLLAAEGAAPLGGGVGHILRRRERGADDAPATLVSVGSLPDLRRVAWAADHVSVGAGVRLSDLAADRRLAAVWPALTEAAGSVATGRIRRLVTLGGNLAARDDRHDPPVALAALGATLIVRGAGGERPLRVADLPELRADELLVAVRLPLPAGRTGSAFEKFLVRGVWEYACVNVAAVVGLDEAGAVRRIGLAVGSVADGPVDVDLADLLGGAPDDALLAEAARRAAAGTRPYGDVRGSAAYKTRMIAEFTRRALTRAIARAARPAAAEEEQR
jgi:aerobic carbon-monoxide dehydrogenase medium subunit